MDQEVYTNTATKIERIETTNVQYLLYNSATRGNDSVHLCFRCCLTLPFQLSLDGSTPSSTILA